MPPRDALMPMLEDVLYGGMLAEGEHVYEFERRFAEHFGLPNALGFSSGTGALHVALLSCGVRPGDEVVTTSMTAEPTNTTILQIGAVPVFADVDPRTGNLEPASVEACIGPRTKAILVVHYAGYPVALNAMRALADRHGVALIEDCAHALGARYAGQAIGTIGDAAIFSFQAIKHMTTVDGGALTLRDPAKIRAAKKLRWFGLEKGVPRTEVDIVEAGYKYNMTNVAGVIGLRQLDDIDEAIARHIAHGQAFDAALSAIPGLSAAAVEAVSEPSYWIYTLLSDDSDAVERRLAEIGVAASKLHRPNHLHSVFAPYRRDLPGLAEFYRRLVHIPCGWWVSDADRERIVSALSKG
ncbi:DegT/DnrJ/EryC1/StrS family aminotransferase [Sphingomonas sp. SUN019]|uniref:DegT/DnrJ/EryC1/StrS family aminotransferase n=1 Tax=Sphingomonas sp. SUN019 TaxID=2937788 RepID=UPI0021648D7E|nr:DegT/DnrJ/EryC1/StrS family aminotransferase [Sphingomonas sp. SUN019]UVO50931.1 DegT/DnrJ/EryC1/StrS family aminotransferase [Sphingomonas sp. SUN019]